MRNGYVAHMWAGGYITSAVLGIPKAKHGDKNEEWPLGPHMGKQATSPLLSWGSRADNNERRLLGPDFGRWLYTPAVLGVPGAKRGDNTKKWRLGPNVGNEATSPLPSWGSVPQSEGTTKRNGYLAHMCASG